jgi:hypothetical protein
MGIAYASHNTHAGHVAYYKMGPNDAFSARAMPGRQVSFSMFVSQFHLTTPMAYDGLRSCVDGDRLVTWWLEDLYY